MWPPPPEAIIIVALYDVDKDVLKGAQIAIAVDDGEPEVEAGADGPAGLLHETDVDDLQDIVVGRVPGRQAGRGAAAAINADGPVQVDGIARQPVGALHDL